LINKIPTLILGMDVSHGPPGRADVPSVAAVLITCLFLCMFIVSGYLRIWLFICLLSRSLLQGCWFKMLALNLKV